MKQSKVLVINDLSSYGRCALTVAIPILSAFGIETCPLPTALLSTNGAFPGHVVSDETEMMEKTMEHFKSLNLTFDAIIIGFLTNVKQVELIKDFIRDVKTEDTLVILDPIMGDHGKLYSVTKPECCNALIELVGMSDVITPNLTECARLLGESYSEERSKEWLKRRCDSLRTLGAKNIVITGIPDADNLLNYISTVDGKDMIIAVKKQGKDRCGTGDVFTSILAGNLVKGVPLIDSVQKAADFLVRAIAYSNDCNSPERNGVSFESFLAEL